MARPTFQVTEQLGQEVKTMTSVGCRQDDIAKVLNTTQKTLRKHFRRELDVGAIQADAQVLDTLFRMATSGTNTAAAIFWARARCGWRENAPVGETRAPEMPNISIQVGEQPKRERIV